MWNFNDQRFAARFPASDEHGYREELKGSSVARLSGILINYTE
jgi:hypothetical protein